MYLNNYFNCSEFEKPVDTEFIRYDIDKHRWILNKVAVTTFLGYDLADFLGKNPKEEEIFLNEMSLDIYSLIKRYTVVASWNTKEYYISNGVGLKQVIMDAMLAQVRASIRSGIHLFKDQHGINLEKGTSLGYKNLRGDINYSAGVLDELHSVGLLFNGYLPPLIEQEFEKGVDY